MAQRKLAIAVLAVGAALMVSAPLWAVTSSSGQGAGGQALLGALREGDTARAAQLIRGGADVNGHDESGSTVLMWAVQRLDTGLVRQLLQAGADPNVVAAHGVGALQIAVMNQTDDIALLLLAAGAKADVARDNGETVLMTASRMGRFEVMKELIARGANVNAREQNFGQTALMWAAGHPEEVKLLLEHGADVHQRSRIWEVTDTIFVESVYETDGKATRSKGGQSALFFAVQEDDVESVKALIGAGADVNLPAADGATALLIALYKLNWAPGEAQHFKKPHFAPNAQIANLLLEHGAKVNVANADGYTPLHCAVLGMVSTARILSRSRTTAYADPLGIVSTKAPLDPVQGLALVKLLLDRGAEVNAQTRYPAQGAIGINNVDSEGFNPLGYFSPGTTPLGIAALSANADLVELLSRHGADPNVLQKDGHSPFSVAIRDDALPLAKIMIAHGADVRRIYNPTEQFAKVKFDGSDDVVYTGQAQARANQTLLHVAAAAGAWDVVPLLAQRGIKIDAKNSLGETALQLAEQEERIRYHNMKQEQQFAQFNPDAKAVKPLRETETSDAIKRVLSPRSVSNHIRPNAAETSGSESQHEPKT